MRVLSDGFYARADELMARYPTRRSAILMLLHEAQDEVGFVSEEIMAEIAGLLDLTMADVAGVVSFYTMFKRTHPGQHLISLCTNPGCVFFGADETAAKLRELIGSAQVTDEDLSWEEVECLAYCSAAPACQVNYRDVPHLTPERAERLVRALRDGRQLDDVIAELRTDAKLPSMPIAGGSGGPRSEAEPLRGPIAGGSGGPRSEAEPLRGAQPPPDQVAKPQPPDQDQDSTAQPPDQGDADD